MDTLREPINAIENKFDDKLGHSEKTFCCQAKLFTEIISVLIILDAFLFFTQTFFRWGAPCFLWWNYISTTITFFMGHGTRLIAIPVGIYSLYSIRKNNSDGIGILFLFLLFSSFVSFLDAILCLFEVHNVCNSKEIEMWNDCSHEWGKQEYICINNNQECIAGLTYDNMERDKENCIGQGCQYIKNTDWIEPECCKDSMWVYHNPCQEDPQIRNKIFDTGWCENFSDLYDVGAQLFTSGILLGFTYVVHSYKRLIDEGLQFTSNPAVGEE